MRRRSSSGSRLVDVEDQVLLFLMRMRRAFPFRVLGALFGISKDTAKNYFDEIRQLFADNVTGTLLHPLNRDELLGLASDKFKEDLPAALLVWDGTGFQRKDKENVAMSRLLYSAYHHQPESSAVFGECL